MNDKVDIDCSTFVTSGSARVIFVVTKKGNYYAWGYKGQEGICQSAYNEVLIPLRLNALPF